MVTKQKDFIYKLILEEFKNLGKYPTKVDIVRMLRYNLTSRVKFPLLSGYIIGSEAKGVAKEDSDLDIGIIIPRSDRITALKRTEFYHSKFTSDEQKPKRNGRFVDFQFFYSDDEEFDNYSKIQIF